ncbi:hypothetical protein KOW79_018010 [Hemibagrus wyckioides]|uniref:39S ribosomal protein L41, mitochondrial n=1 Tax=Hemibagrus wyckioides TaxID=337641 RepID=A0A9D3NBX6_9TELE|nr:hypothetical protein KOW79_018010 [Hemibagrus wyckioides]
MRRWFLSEYGWKNEILVSGISIGLREKGFGQSEASSLKRPFRESRALYSIHAFQGRGDRTAEFTSKRGPKTFYKSRGARPAGVLTSSRKFIPVQEMIPQFVVPNLEGFKLKAYVSYRTPPGTEQPMTAESIFNQAVAPHIQRDFEANEFDPQQLEKYGLEKTQEGKLFKLYPKNFIR